MPAIRDLKGRPIDDDNDRDERAVEEFMRRHRERAESGVVNVPIPDDVATLIARMNAQVDVAVAAVAEVKALALAIEARIQHDVNRFGRLAQVEDVLKKAGLSL